MERYGNSDDSMSKEMEVDDEESDSENDKIGVGRTYECSYCKRGFTNAQALGGHMNIHRKDKAKAKQQQQQQSYNNYSPSSSISYKPFKEPISTYSTPFAPQRNFQGYHPFANSPRFSSQPLILEGKSRLFGLYEDHLGSDLSLRISSSSINHQHQGGIDKNKKKEGDIDLELRLGYDR